MSSRRLLRTVWPEFFIDVALFEAEEKSSLPLRTALIALWTCADREGRFKWVPKILKLQCLPHDNVDFEVVLVALQRSGHVRGYMVDGTKYGCVMNWARQVINAKERASELPPPPPVPIVIATRPDHDVTALASKEDRDVIVPASREDHDAKIAIEAAPSAPQDQLRMLPAVGKAAEGSSRGTTATGQTPQLTDLLTEQPSLTELLYEAADGKVEAGSPIAPMEQLIAAGCDLELDILPVLRDRVSVLKEPLRNWRAIWVKRDFSQEGQQVRGEEQISRRPQSGAHYSGALRRQPLRLERGRGRFSSWQYSLDARTLGAPAWKT